MFGFGNSNKSNGNGNSKNQNKNNRQKYNHHQKENSCINNSNNGNNNHQKLEQRQVFKQGQTQSQEKIVLHTQIVLDQLQNCFEMFASFVPAVMTKKNKKGKKIGSAEMQARNSLVVGSVNIFGSMCVDLQEYKNVRALDIASQQLYTYVQGLGKPEFEILKPFLQYMNCAANGVKVPVLPAIEVDAKQWNSKNVNSMLSGLLGSGHVIKERHDGYRKKIQQLDEQLEQVWRRNGKKSANISSGNGTGTPLPDVNSMYRHSGAHVKLSHEFKNNKFANAPMRAQLECQGDHDFEQRPSQSRSRKDNICDVDEEDARLADWLVSIGFKRNGRLHAMKSALSNMGIGNFDELNACLIQIYHKSDGKELKSRVNEMKDALAKRGIQMTQRIIFLDAAEMLVQQNSQHNNENKDSRMKDN